MKHQLQTVRSSAFTLVEVLVAVSLSVMVLAVAVAFIMLAGKTISGALTQSNLNAQAGRLIEFIQLRARVATRVIVDTNGLSLTLGFDDDTNLDSDSDGSPYNDVNHREQFLVRDGDNNVGTAENNALIYLRRVGLANEQVLVPTGLRKLPGKPFFSLTNGSTVLISFGIVDSYTRDNYQSIDIQGIAVPLNRGASSNIVSILP